MTAGRARRATRRAYPTLRAALVGLVAAAAVVAISGSATATVVAPLALDYNQTVYGDFVIVGNGVMRCPDSSFTGDREFTDAQCVRASNRLSNGSQSPNVNDNYFMQFTDVDGDATTFNSSSATVTIPPGATVDYAKLSWAGNTGVRAGTTANRCAASPPANNVPPAGAPETQTVKLKVGTAAYTNLAPAGYEFTAEPAPPTGNSQYYSADATVTPAFTGVTTGSPVTVTVGNIWAPQGYGCFAGWSLYVVYKYPAAHPAHAPSLREIFIYDGHVRQASTDSATTVNVTGFRVAGGAAARVGMTAYEGDWGITGDQFAINNTTIAEPEAETTTNFFISHADGDSNPTPPNNMSVDAKDFSVSTTIIKPGDTSAALKFSTTGDSYLVQNVALSVPVPELKVTKVASPPVVHTGDTVTFTIAVHNPSLVAATNVVTADPLAPGCNRNIGTLLALQTVTYTCTMTAPTADFTNTVTATGTSPLGDSLTGTATAAVDVIHPAIDIVKDTTTPLVNEGQTVSYRVTVTNTGDVPLTNVAVSDPLVASCSRTIGTLVVGGNTNYTCTITAGATGFVNTASAAGTDPLGLVVTDADTADFAVAQPRLVLDKAVASVTDSNGNGRNDAGDVINFTFSVTNAGNVAVNQLAVADPKVGAVTCPVTSLDSGGNTICTAGYTITQADVDAGSVDNIATASGRSPTNAVVTSSPDSTTTPMATAATLALVKTAGAPTDVNGNGITDPGDTIVYTFAVTNTGGVTIANVAVNDPKVGPVSCPAGSLAPGVTKTCTTTHPYSITQADMDAGAVNNTATATGTTPSGGPVTSNPSSTSTPVTAIATITLDKSAATPVDANGSGRVDAGDTIGFSFVVTNTGTVTVSNVAVNDPKAGAVTCPTAPVAPAASTTCTATYTITQADVNAGEVENTADATGTEPGGDPVPSNSDTTTTPIDNTAALGLDKEAATPIDNNGNDRVDTGDTINFTFLVSNTGPVPVTTLVVDDPKVGAVSCPSTTLAPGAATTCTASYAITQADADEGAVANTATATGTPPPGQPLVTSPPDSTVTRTSDVASLTLDKTAGTPVDANGNGVIGAGDTIAYTFVVRNTGSVTLTGVAIADPNVASVSCPVTTIAPGASVTCTALYTITQTDVDDGRVENTATATGTPPNGPPVTSPPDGTTTRITPVAAISLDKLAATPVDVNGNGLTDVGDTIQFSFLVTNTGSVTLTDQTVTDPKVGSVVCSNSALPPGTSKTCTAAPYTITEADVDAGSVDNTAIATGSRPGTSVQSAPDSTSTPTSHLAALTLDKSAGTPNDLNGNGLVDAEDTIDFTFELENTGTVTLTDVAVDDPKIGAVTCPSTTLAAGATMTCTATYTITQADVDAGAVENTATGTGTPPGGPPPVTTPPDTTTTPTAQEPMLGLEKSVAAVNDLNGNGLTDVGDTIDFSFLLGNIGSVTLHDVSVTDPKVGAVDCPPGDVAPTEIKICTATYTITQADVDAGSVDNTAIAHGTPPTGPPIDSNEDDTSTPTDVTASITLDKSAAAPTDVNGNGSTDAGDTIEFSFLVTNTGSVTISDVAIADSKVPTVSCPVGDLAPTESKTCLATYTITQADVDAGSVDNVATASGTDPFGDPVPSNDDDTTTPIVTSASLTLDKTAGTPTDVNGNGRTDAGDTIAYTFLVTNTGTVTLTGVVVDDPKAGSVACPTTTLPPTGLATCTATYTITQADVDAGTVVNTATASGTPPGGAPPVTTLPDSTTTPTDSIATITIEKTAASPTDANGNGLRDAGDTIAYTFLVTNTGSVTLTAVAVTDPKVGVVTCPSTTLPPLASMTCTAAPYVITQADVDAGTVDNTAAATGTPPGGAPPVTSPPDSTSTPTDSVASLALEKSVASVDDVNGNGLTDAHDVIQYEFEVTNDGTVTLTLIGVSDPKIGPVTCPVTTLEPGGVTVCTGSYSISQADVDTGTVDNTATVTGTPPGGAPPVTSPPDDTSTPTDAVADITLTKRLADPNGDGSTDDAIADVNGNSITDAGDTIAYEFVVTNAGTLTLDAVSVSDPKVGPVTCPASQLVASDTMVCTATYTITQADVDVGRVDNTATATGTPSNGGPPVTSPPSSTSTPTEGEPAIQLAKSAAVTDDANGNGLNDAGDLVTYTFVVTNTGSLTLSNVTVNDPKVSSVTCDDTTLAPAASTECTATYVITQTDVDAGAVDNVATATGTPPQPEPPIESPPAGARIVTDRVPAITVDKLVREVPPGVVDANGNGVIDAGDTIAYEFIVTNTGTVTLSAIAVSDSKVGAVTCPPGALAPIESMTCTASYTIVQADVDAGSVDNVATAIGTPPGGAPTVTSPPDAVSTPIAKRIAVGLEKSVTQTNDVNGNGRVDAGDTIEYSFVVTNTGTVTLTGITVNDPLVASISCSAGDLAPQASKTCAGTYTITQADVDAGSVDNIATATGDPPGDDPPVTSPPDETSTPTDDSASLALEKSVAGVTDTNGNGRTDAGDQVRYSFTVTNTGVVSLVNVTIADPLLAKLGITVSCPADLLLPLLSITCTSDPYTITAADQAAGGVNNVATAWAMPPTQTPLQSGESVAGLQLTPAPSPSPSPSSVPPTSIVRRPVARTGADTGNATLLGLVLVSVGAMTVIVAGRRRRAVSNR